MRNLFLFCLFVSVASGQTTINGGRVILGTLDGSGAAKTAPVRTGANDPSACDASVREMFFNTTTNTLKVCTAANTWTAVGGNSTFYFVAGYGNALALSPGGTTRFYGGLLGAVTAFSADEAPAEMAVPRNGTLTKFYLRFQCSYNAAYGNSGCWIRKNGANTALDLRWACDDTIKSGTSTATVPVAQYDRISIQCINNGSANVAQPLQVVMELQ